MPLLFVHGVASRDTHDYQNGVSERKRFFKQTVLKGYLGNEQAEMFFPMWGELVPRFSKDSPIIPMPSESDDYVTFGANPDTFDREFPAAILTEKGDSKNPLLTLARQSFPDFVDHLVERTLSLPDVKGIPEAENDVIAAGICASLYLEDNPDPEWVQDVAEDEEFIKRFLEELENWDKESSGKSYTDDYQSFGAGSKIIGWFKKATKRLEATVVDVPNNAILQLLRPNLTQRMVEFFGDVFYYQAHRGDNNNPGAIVQTILTDMQKARDNADRVGEALVVVGHSMGGNILYDILTHFAPDLSVDALITVGSQASLFKQLQLFKTQQNDSKRGEMNSVKLPAPRAVSRWLNIFDPQDPLGFCFEPAFEGVEDFSFESPGGLTTAHSDYFKRIRFYERLNHRLMGQREL